MLLLLRRQQYRRLLAGYSESVTNWFSRFRRNISFVGGDNRRGFILHSDREAAIGGIACAISCRAIHGSNTNREG